MGELNLEASLFREEGFKRKQCKKCGKYFWTLDQERPFCGEQPCVEPGFIGNPPPARKLSLPKLRQTFLSFCQKNGHTVTESYPVVARWRDDVYLVGATIYDFQPWVTSGVAEPPANPLAISQPCIRLTDVDNVGRTARYLTGFEMMAHHAFNFPSKDVYWLDETVRLCYEFFTKALGIPRETIQFKEEFWSGGGNGGEDFEVIIQDTEAATLVFMHYAMLNGTMKELDSRIVDTGYGLERISWIIHGSPTICDKPLDYMLHYLRHEGGIPQPDQDMMQQFARVSGMLNIESEESVKAFQDQLAKRLEMPWEDIRRTIEPVESLYAIADHTRSIAWLLLDGVVPSNSGVGYLTRLLVRRTLRHIARLGLQTHLYDLIDLHLKHEGRDLADDRLQRSSILEILRLEEERFLDSSSRGRQLVERELANTDATEFPTAKLAEYYDSHGIPPEAVKDIAKKMGIRVSVPPNFYAIVAQRHQAPEAKPLAAKHIVGGSLPSNIPKTALLYYRDPYQHTFEATALDIVDREWLVLDKTAFYAEGGGQPSDHGVLKTSLGEASVAQVTKKDDVVLHRVEAPHPFKRGMKVKGEIDWSRRLALMRSHTATHILLAAAREKLGKHVWQAGAQKGMEINRLDITHYKHLSVEDARQIEERANEIVMANIPIRARFMKRAEAEKKFGFTLYQGGAIPGGEIRVCEIKNTDAQACGGTHCTTTGEVGFIRILRVERIQDGVERLEYSAGLAAVRSVHQIEDSLASVAKTLSTSVADASSAAQKWMESWEASQKMLKTYRRLALEGYVQKATDELKPIGDYSISVLHIGEAPADDLIEIATRVAAANPKALCMMLSQDEKLRFVLAAGSQPLKAGIHAGSISRRIAMALDGGGGGKPDLGQGAVPRGEKVEKLKTLLESELKKP